MRVCPTEALRVRDGKAELYNNRCIDCGECFRVCPVNAIIIEQDDFSKIFNFTHRVALVPAVLLGQFPEGISPSEVYAALKELGFTEIFEVENSTKVLTSAINSYINNEDNSKPVISTFCPAVVRLVQVRFPALVDNLMLLKAPLDISAIYYRKMLVDKGVKSKDIGIFYITPCPAKIAAIKSPVGEDHSEVDGVINMDVIYNKVLRIVKQKLAKSISSPPQLSPVGILWALTRGESANVNGRCLSIDNLHNVIEFLEKVENDEISEVDFIEIRSCDEGCAGGVLTTGNRFLTVEKLNKLALEIKSKNQANSNYESFEMYEGFLNNRISTQPVTPRSMLKLDENMSEAMKKMERVHRYMCFLPGIDCGACGAPSCQALARDIVNGLGAISHCVFIQKTMEQNRKLNPDHSYRIMERIWGKDRFQKNCNKVLGRKKE
jgi:iron only hydrogenase large subunit-like protein